MTNEYRQVGVWILGWICACDPESHSAAAVDAVDIRPRGGEGGPAIGRRWVLRDGDGNAVNAVVEPTCNGNGPDCLSNEIGHTGGITPECARVIWLDEQYVDLKYSLTTGRVEDCRGGSSPTIADFGVFPDATCKGPFYTPAELGIESAHRFVRRNHYIADEDRLYFQGTELVTQKQWYGGSNCQPYEPGGFGDTQAPWLPVPDWALNALANAPYVMSWE
jgi:hypothetical protein